MHQDPAPLDRLLASCADRGIDLGAWRPAFLSRRLVRAAMLAGEVFLDRMVDRLLADPEALERFLGELSVGVSSFFRDPLPWALLEARIVPALAEAGHFTAWSVACARGEEAWSLAMLLAELAPGSRVIASDRSAAFVADAARGRYGAAEVEGVTLGRLRHHFVEQGNDWVVGPGLRASVRFRVEELAGGGPDDLPAASVSLALCRNLLIYLTAAGRLRLLEHLERIVAPGGYLLLGQAEQLPANTRFVLVDEVARLYRKEPA